MIVLSIKAKQIAEILVDMRDMSHSETLRAMNKVYEAAYSMGYEDGTRDALADDLPPGGAEDGDDEPRPPREDPQTGILE